jgi:hypothetical protein
VDRSPKPAWARPRHRHRRRPRSSAPPATKQAVELLMNDPATEGIVMIGEIGGRHKASRPLDKEPATRSPSWASLLAKPPPPRRRTGPRWCHRGWGRRRPPPKWPSSCASAVSTSDAGRDWRNHAAGTRAGPQGLARPTLLTLNTKAPTWAGAFWRESLLRIQRWPMPTLHNFSSHEPHRSVAD